MPLSLSDEELHQLLELAEPVAYGQRPAFLAAVAGELAACPHRGPGVTHRIAAQIQRKFVLMSQRVPPERETSPSTGAATSQGAPGSPLTTQ
jgi:hypothetical protein